MTVWPDPIVELFLGAAWVAVSDRVLVADGVDTSRGTSDLLRISDPASASFTLKNDDGLFSPRNPNSPHYGLLTRNVPVRVTISGLVPEANGRVFHGFIAEWPISWTPDEGYVPVQIEAAGGRRRLSRARDLQPAFTRWLDGRLEAGADIHDFWPLDAVGQPTSVSNLLKGHNGRITGLIEFGVDAGAAVGLASMARVTQTGSGFRFVPSGSSNPGDPPDYFMGYTMRVPTTTGPSDLVGITTFLGHNELARAYLFINASGLAVFESFEADGASNGTSTGDVDLRGATWNVVWLWQESAGNASITVNLSRMEDVDSATDETVGHVDTLNPGSHVAGFTSLNLGWEDYEYGGVTAASGVGAMAGSNNAVQGFPRVSTVTVFERSCEEVGAFPLSLVSQDATTLEDNTTRMDGQPPESFESALSSIVDTEFGLIDEWPQLGDETDPLIMFITRGWMVSNEAIESIDFITPLILDYDAGVFASVPEPLEDDQTIINDASVRVEASGSKFRRTITTGALGDNTVGTYQGTRAVNCWPQSAGEGLAGMLAHIGTVDEPRFDSIVCDWVDLQRLGLELAALQAVPGLRLRLVNMPTFVTPNDVDLLVIGRSIRWDGIRLLVTFTCVPGEVHRGAWSQPNPSVTPPTDNLDRAAAPASYVLNTDYSAISMIIRTFIPDGVGWADENFPYDIDVAGERMTVNDVTNGIATTALHVTRSVNGIVKDQTAGTPVQVWRPSVAVAGLVMGTGGQ